MLRNSEGIIVRLLIVEDEVRLASALQRGLIGEGFSVDVTHTGPDGLHAAQENQYDAVILDIMLPGLSGYRIIERLRGAKNWVPILMLTAKDGEYDEADALDLGADDYLTKPFSFVVLLARLRALLRRGVTPRPAALTVGDLVLDPAAHTVVRGERSVDLTPREFALLEYLMRRPGQAVSKADILHHVWDAHYDGDANVVEVYVGYLRRKIDTPFARQTVQTVRGAGYRLSAEEPDVLAPVRVDAGLVEHPFAAGADHDRLDHAVRPGRGYRDGRAGGRLEGIADQGDRLLGQQDWQRRSEPRATRQLTGHGARWQRRRPDPGRRRQRQGDRQVPARRPDRPDAATRPACPRPGRAQGHHRRCASEHRRPPADQCRSGR